MIVASFDIDPVAKGRARFTRQGRAYTPAKTRSFESTLRSLAHDRMTIPLPAGPLRVEVTYFFAPTKSGKNCFPIVKPDLDNLIKSLDAFNGIFWVDDKQIVEIEARKHYDWNRRVGSIHIVVSEIPVFKIPKKGSSK